mgnify:CR=1 FL=1
MIINGEIRGKNIVLRSVDEGDSEFIINLRNDDKLTQYIPKITVTIEQQKGWVANQRTILGDYYFLILNRHLSPLGTIGLTGLKNNEIELGRFISRGNAVENLESSLIVCDYVYNVLNVQEIRLEVVKENVNVLSLWRRLGAKDRGESTLGEFETFIMYLF